jgi:hypothetical protein
LGVTSKPSRSPSSVARSRLAWEIRSQNHCRSRRAYSPAPATRTRLSRRSRSAGERAGAPARSCPSGDAVPLRATFSAHSARLARAFRAAGAYRLLSAAPAARALARLRSQPPPLRSPPNICCSRPPSRCDFPSQRVPTVCGGSHSTTRRAAAERHRWAALV